MESTDVHVLYRDLSLKGKEKPLYEFLIEKFLFLSASLAILTTLGIILVLGIEAALFFREVSIWEFVSSSQWTPLFYEKHYGILPLLCGTVLVSTIAILVALPAGLTIAIFLSEFSGARLKAIVKPLLEILAGIPTVVYGYFALVVVTPLLQSIIPELSGFNALSPGIVMGFMILPLVASLSEDALSAVPQSLRDGSMGLGATKLQTALRVVVPAGFGGITASFILAASRAIGETMIVVIAAGQQPIVTLNPLQAVETMTAYIVGVSLGDTPHGTLEYHTIFAVGFSLFILTFILNSFSVWLRDRLKDS